MAASAKKAIEGTVERSDRSIPTVLRKHVGAVQIRNDLSLLERKAFSVLLVNAYDELPNFSIPEHSIPVETLSYLAGFNSRNVQYLKDTLLSLMTTALQWNVQVKEGKDRWAASATLASARFDNGVCHYAFSPELRRRLFNPEVYAQLDLAVIREFKSKYALALFENCMLFAEDGRTPDFALGTLRDILGASSTPGYENFARLVERVIKPAVNEVNSVSTLRLEPVFHREARKVTSLRFNIAIEDKEGQGDVPANPLEGRDPALMQQLQTEAGLGYAQIIKLCEEHSDERLRLVLRYTAGRVSSGKVPKAKFAPYFLRTVKHATDESLGSPQATLALAPQGPSEAEQREAEAAKARSEAYKRQMALAGAAWDALTEAEREHHKSAFMGFLSENDRIFYDTFRRSGVDTGAGRIMLLQHLLDNGHLVLAETIS